MQRYYLKIVSKNEKSLDHFSHFFHRHLKTKFNIIQRPILTRNKRKIITLLKSPHVNKTAQEHFEIRIFSKHFCVELFYSQKTLIILKKILDKLFQDISIRLEFITDLSSQQKNNKLIFHPNNYKLFFSNLSKTNMKRSTYKTTTKQFYSKKKNLFNLTKFLSTISIFGEILVLTSKE